MIDMIDTIDTIDSIVTIDMIDMIRTSILSFHRSLLLYRFEGADDCGNPRFYLVFYQ